MDSLQLELKRVIQDSTRCRLLNVMINLETEDSVWAKYNSQMIEIAERNALIDQPEKSLNVFKMYMAIGYKLQGYIAQMKGENIPMMNYYNKSLSLFEKLNDEKGIATTLNNLGGVYYNFGNIHSALEYWQKALNLLEKNGDKREVAGTLNNLAALYASQFDEEKALEYYKRCMQIQKELGDKEAYGITLLNIGSTHSHKKESVNALKYFEEAHKLFVEIKNKRRIAQSLKNIGVVNRHKGNYNVSLEKFQECLSLEEALRSKHGIAKTHEEIALVYLEQKKYDIAKPSLKKAYALAKELGYPDLIRSSSFYLYKVAVHEGRSEEALEMYKEFVKMKDSIENVKNQKAALQNALQYKFGKQMAEDSVAHAKEKQIVMEEKRISELELQQSRYLTLALSVFLLFSVITAVVILRQNKLKAEQKAMQLEQKLLRLQMNPHFIFNSLQAIQNFIKDKDAAKYLSSFGALTRGVLENSRLESIPLNKEIALLEHYLELQKLLHEEQFTYTISISPTLDTETIDIPPMLSQPFIENAIEHGMRDIKEGGLIEISFSENNSNLIFEVKDNGRGLTVNSNKDHHSLATTITKERLDLLNKKKSQKASFTISEAFPGKERKGVKVNFTIPI